MKFYLYYLILSLFDIEKYFLFNPSFAHDLDHLLEQCRFIVAIFMSYQFHTCAFGMISHSLGTPFVAYPHHVKTVKQVGTYKSVFELPSVAEENVYILSLHYLDRNFADLCTLLFDHWPRQRYSMKVWTLHNNCLAYFTRSSVNLGVIVLAYLTGQKHVCLCVFSVKD